MCFVVCRSAASQSVCAGPEAESHHGGDPKTSQGAGFQRYRHAWCGSWQCFVLSLLYSICLQLLASLVDLLPLRWIGASSCSHQKRHCCHWEEWSHRAQPDQGTMLAILVQRYHCHTAFILCMWDITFNDVTWLPRDETWKVSLSIAPTGKWRCA